MSSDKKYSPTPSLAVVGVVDPQQSWSGVQAPSQPGEQRGYVLVGVERGLGMVPWLRLKRVLGGGGSAIRAQQGGE